MDTIDNDRQYRQARRRVYWDGDWYSKLEDDVRACLGSQRREIMGILDQSCCLGPQLCRELAVCYVQPPEVLLAGQPAPIAEAGGPIEKAMLWSMMPEAQGIALWVQEAIVRIENTPDGNLRYRPVRSEAVVCEPDPYIPGQPAYYREAVPRMISGEPVETFDELDIRERGKPS